MTTGIRLFTDEMIRYRIARQLQQQGYDALSCEDAGRANLAIPDEEQLAYAAQAGRAILTYNGQDYVRLDGLWKAAGKRHAGIIVVSRRLSQTRLLPYVVRHLDTVPPDVQDDMLLWLDTSSPL